MMKSKIVKQWVVRIAAIAIVLIMIFAGFVAILYK